MSSIPYSRYLFYPVTWYSFLIVAGASVALLLACREEKRVQLPHDTILDLALWLIPGGIIGARIYYVLFSFHQFHSDLLSVFRIWEGGLAIYGGIIAGLLVMFFFCRHRNLSFLLLCDIIVPGLAFAQSVGRWGNWFNMEAFGLPVTDSFPCVFPLAVQIPADGYAWHLATFFYESVWDFAIFVFLLFSRHALLKKEKGDVFFFYLFLYASGRLIIEELRIDSLFASSVRISQLLSALLCASILFRYRLSSVNLVRKHPFSAYFLFPLSVIASTLIILYSIFGHALFQLSAKHTVFLLCTCSVIMICGLFSVYIPRELQEVKHADNCI
ncbi:MAG: prolipoprotein diacylglyceryl transferase [Clostridia bacterium]|nr:prolipoprotein diacylglyceryl transferase [Clostridia bacterium]